MVLDLGNKYSMDIPHSSERSIYNFLFFFFAFLCVSPVWWFPGFLTADGPCHVYNAAVLKDFFTGDTSFYGQFYTVNMAPEPNWFSHFFLAFLMFIFSPQVAEKILITVCVLNLAFGYRYFLAAIQRENTYLAIAVFPFLWQMAMLMGFYNYMLSIGSMFWIAGYWVHIRGRISAGRMVFLSLCCLGVYFMHLLGIVLAGTMMGLTTLTSYKKTERKPALAEIMKLLIIFLPAILLVLNYIGHNTSDFNNEYKATLPVLWDNLWNIFSLQSIHPDEYRLTPFISVFIFLCFIYAVVIAVFKQRGSLLWVMPLVIVVILILAYFFAYESMLGGSYIRPRLECLIFLFALIAVATIPVPKVMRVSIVIFFSACTLIYSIGRWGAFRDANVMVQEFRSLRPYIKDQSVVLPLKYANFPTDYRGEKVMASKVLLFSHIGEAMYAKGMHLVFCENYEANTGYFPLLWKERVNPFLHLGKGPGIEATPPDADIKGYNDKNHRIDNIVIWGRQGDILKDPLTQSLGDSVNKYYELVHVTPLYKIELYRLKNI